MLTNLKNAWTNWFAHTLICSFSNIYKGLVSNLEIPGTIVLLIPFFKYLKNDTYRSEKYLGQFICLYTFPNT